MTDCNFAKTFKHNTVLIRKKVTVKHLKFVMCTDISLRINHCICLTSLVTGGFTQFERVSSIETLAISSFRRACQVSSVNIFFL